MSDLAAMRRSYALAGLSEDDLAPTWLDQLERWLGEAVDAGVAEPNAMVLATADAGGRPSARTVLLKGLDARGLSFYTNLASRKAGELAANPQAAAVLPWLALGRQVCVTGRVERVDAAEADAYFATRPRGSQLGAHASPQSRVIPARDVLERAFVEAQRRFAAAVPRPDGWGGLRIVPDAVEFWQGRPDRLHDRLRFRRAQGDAWVVERLAP